DSAAGSGLKARVKIATGVRIVAEENVAAERPRRMSTLPMVTSSVSATPEHESGTPLDSIIGLNVRTIGASERFVISSYSFHHSSTHASEAEGDSIIWSNVVPLKITCSCFHGFINKDLINLVIPDVRSNHYIEPTELKIQEMVNIWVSGEA
nr:hypothetical protein [Tanacetum cinerariifolium]